MSCDFMSLTVCFLDCGVIGVFMAYKEGSLDVAAVGIFALAVKHFFVQFNVVIVDGIVKSDGDHLRDVLGR